MRTLCKLMVFSGLAALFLSAGRCAAFDQYMVIDISAGYSGPYPVAHYATLPLAVTDNSCKTDKIVLKRVAPGTFMMGSATNEVGRLNNEDPHQVTLSQDYYLSVYAITEYQWNKVTGLGAEISKKPIRNVLYVAQIEDQFLAQLNLNTELGALLLDLPTEAQWEYACRAGTTTPYSFGSNPNNLQHYAWYQDYDNNLHEVGLRVPNDWGFYDMHGNVEEFCRDAYVARLGTNSVTDPFVSSGTGDHVTKGGAYSRPAAECRSAYRNSMVAGGNPLVGFRLSLTLPRLYDLTVVNGSGSGSYTNAHVQQIIADLPAVWSAFDKWVGGGSAVDDVYAPTTTVTLAGADLTLTATYKTVAYSITVSNGTAAVYNATNGQSVAIYANPPAATNIFYRWEGDVATVANISLPTTTVTIAGASVSLAATYRHAPYWLSVTNGAEVATSRHFAGEVVSIQAPAPAAHHTFLWVGDTATLANRQAWETTLVMPARDVGLRATYPDKLYTLSVTDGSGSGSYTHGTRVAVSAGAAPSTLHLFDAWGGDVAGLDSADVTSTFYTIAGSDAAISPRYKPVAATEGKYLVVKLLSDGTASDFIYMDAPPSGGWDTSHKSSHMAFKRVMHGVFEMGRDDSGAVQYEDIHTVTLTESFYIGVYEVTQRQWQHVTGTNPSGYTGAGRDYHPVENITYEQIRGALKGNQWPATANVDTNSFVGKLRLKLSSDGFDLPTEAQWEYACRAGTTGSWYSPDLLNIAVYGVNSSNRTWAVGSKIPNSWGLYDMHGNVQEWCLDWFTGTGLGTAPQTDPPGAAAPDQTYKRAVRGGHYDNIMNPAYIKSGVRAGQLKTTISQHTGFRMIKAAGVPRQLTVIDSKVNSGGIFYYRAQVAISAVDKPGLAFDHWSVTPATLYPGARFNAQARDTIITMPNQAITIKAEYR
ncbi:MAG: formylglycine-generating enzyme family protein [Kiritimatiellae bacterium]|nr:formylglycine-generating enzyme family protein [Kiritimatiellia bacterium]